MVQIYLDQQKYNYEATNTLQYLKVPQRLQLHFFIDYACLRVASEGIPIQFRATDAV